MMIPAASPDYVFRFIETVRRLEPCTIEQIRAELRAQWPPVRSTKSFAQHFGLVITAGDKITLTDACRRMLRYKGTKRINFLIAHLQPQEIEPMAYLARTLGELNGHIEKRQITDFLRNRFEPNAKWDKKKMVEISECYAKWFHLLRMVSIDSSAVQWIQGGISTFDITALAEQEYLQDRMIYDYLVERFPTPKNTIDEPHRIRSSVANEKDDRKRGTLFEDFVVSCSRLLGFSPRSKAGPREQGTNLTYQGNKGGGDVVLLSHFPIHTATKEFEGCALACEAKSTEGQVGSRAVGQARNLQIKIEEAYANYLVYPIVVSRAKYGYDESGRDISPPEVILLNQDTLLGLCKVQKERLEKGIRLLLPVHFMATIDELMKLENLEPSANEFYAIIKKIAFP